MMIRVTEAASGDGVVSALLNSEQAAERLGLKATTLDQYRWKGIGPRYYKLGKFVRYDADELDAWVRRRLISSTSEVPSNGTA